MKDKRIITFVYEFQSRNYLVFNPVPCILYPKSVLHPLSKERLIITKQEYAILRD